MKEGFWERSWRAISAGHRPFLILMLAGLAMAVWWGNDYGMSFDEGRNAGVGEASLAVYTGQTGYFDLGSLDEHGPAYFMFFVATSKVIHALSPAWTLADGRHFTNFLMFLLAVASFYWISLRLLSRRGAWMATLLFSTQPLLFGQGFINQKDIPFLGLFMATLAMGLAASDHWERLWLVQHQDSLEGLQAGGTDSIWSSVKGDFSALSPLPRRLLRGLGAAIVLVSLDLLLGGFLRYLGESLVRAAYHGQAPGPLQSLFNAVATDAYKTPLDMYLAKFDKAFRILRLAVPPVLVGGWLLLMSLVLPTGRSMWRKWIRDSRRWSWHWTLLASAVLLGLTICVRQLGVFVGGLVTLIVLYKGRTRAILPLVVYWAIALAVALATWPYLWPNPPARFVESMVLAANFPPHSTLFRGRFIFSDKYPWYYFPNLAGIQLTESAVILSVVGAGLAFWRLLKRDARWPLIVLLALWAGVPLYGLIAFKMTVYGNITHLLFVLPPFFMVAGLALERLMSWLHRTWLRGVVLLAILLPGLWGITWLHPYEYIYINSFAGGVSGASGFYELDRACLSLREGIEYINRVATEGATVMLPPQITQVVPYARPDLRLIDSSVSYDGADFVDSCTWTHGYPAPPAGEFVPVYEVKRGTAVLTTVYMRIATR